MKSLPENHTSSHLFLRGLSYKDTTVLLFLFIKLVHSVSGKVLSCVMCRCLYFSYSRVKTGKCHQEQKKIFILNKAVSLNFKYIFPTMPAFTKALYPLKRFA